jgi:hypothetical protein
MSEALGDTLVSRMDAHQQCECLATEDVACQEATEDYPEKMEANPEEMKSVAEHEKVSMEEAAVKPVRALKKWHRGWHLGAGCCSQLKEHTEGKGGCRKKLATAYRRMTRHAGVACHKGHCCQGHRKDVI